MMKTHNLYRYARLAAAAAAIAGIAGCATTPTRIENLISCKEPHVGYWAARAAGNAKLEMSYAAKIANNEFILRKKTAPGATLDELRAYREILIAPVNVSTSISPESPDLSMLPRAEITRIDNYIAANEAARTIDGATSSKEWARELEKVAELMGKLEAKVGQILQEAEAKLKAGDLAGALAAWQRATELDHTGPAIVQAEKLIRTEQAKIGLPGLVNKTDSLRKEVQGIQKDYFGSPSLTEAHLKRCTELLDAAEKAIADFRENLRLSSGQTLEGDEINKTLHEIETNVASLIGQCWGEEVCLMTRGKQFWSAYEYTDERIKETAGLKEDQRTVRTAPLSDAFQQMLIPSVTFCVNQANKHFSQDAYGISVVFCRMAEEILQYARTLKLALPVEALTWEKRCRESRVDAEKKIMSAMQRRIIIGDFTPQNPENQSLTTTIYGKCARVLSETVSDRPQAAWGVAVEKITTETKPQPSDYVVDCDISEFLITDQTPVELDRSILKVHRDIHEVPNPLYDPQKNPKERKTVFSQEVYLYQKIRTQHAKKARLKMAVTCAHKGRKESLLTLDTDFTGNEAQLKDVQMSCIEEQLDVPFSGPPRTSYSSSELSVDPWPKATPASLSSAVEIRTAMQQFVADSVVQAVMSLAGSYPLDFLAAEALRQQKLGNDYESADYWGQCLEYCFLLTAEEEKDESESGWIVSKNKMLSRISEFSATCWKDSDSALLRKIPDIWSTAVASALKASEITR